jgi:hypothetical protein
VILPSATAGADGRARRVAFAPAKINLTLRITGRRPDGYHDLESLVAFADIGDTLTLDSGPELATPPHRWARTPTTWC